MGWMVGVEGTSQVLGAEELEVVGDREDFGFGVEVVGRGVLKGASAEPEGPVLDGLEFGNVGGGGIRKPNGGSIGENRTNEGFKVWSIVSFWCPQDVPARALRMFKREEARAAMEEMWGEKLKWVSKVTPRILGVFARGKGMLLMEMLGWRLDW